MRINRTAAAAYMRGCKSGYRAAMLAKDVSFAIVVALSAACGSIGAVALILLTRLAAFNGGS
jgi:hypothetical protein